MFLWEEFITPSPPGVLIVDVNQELRHWPPARRQETHHLADAAVCGLPLLQLIIDEFQPPELVIEQRPDFREPRRWPDPGVKPREVPRPSPRARQGVRRRGPAARRRRPHSWDDHAIGSVGGRRVCDSMARTLLTVMQ